MSMLGTLLERHTASLIYEGLNLVKGLAVGLKSPRQDFGNFIWRLFALADLVALTGIVPGLISKATCTSLYAV